MSEPGAELVDEPMVALTPEVAAFLLEVVNSIQLAAAADNFGEQAMLIVAAKTQLRVRT